MIDRVVGFRLANTDCAGTVFGNVPILRDPFSWGVGENTTLDDRDGVSLGFYHVVNIL